MEQYNVTGMSCAACSSRVEKAVSKVPGVTSCSVSLLTNSMGVEGTATSGSAGRSRNTGAEKTTDRICRFFAGTDVLFHGTYDVGLAASGMVRR